MTALNNSRDLGARCDAVSARRGFRDARGYAAVLSLLSILFALRVLGQALRHWLSLPFLPPFDALQGSGLPYSALLAAQLAILGVMARLCWRVHLGTLAPSRGTGTVLGWAGGIYMAVALGRIAIGVSLAGASRWFTTWIPAAFHVVLAGFALALAFYHQRK